MEERVRFVSDGLKLAGVLHGWARPGILDAYEAERQPIEPEAEPEPAAV